MANDTTPKALREYCRQLGLTEARTGQPIDRLIALARSMEDPRAWLAALSDVPPETEAARTARQPVPPEVLAVLHCPDVESAKCRDGEVFLDSEGKVIDPMRIKLRPTAAPGSSRCSSRRVSLSIPVSDEEPVGYLEHEMHLDVRLDPAASRAFRRVWSALDAENERLFAGRHVGTNRANVVRWIFEQLAGVLEHG
jgi:hypothetical protein